MGADRNPRQFRKFTILFKNLMPAKVGSHLEADVQAGRNIEVQHIITRHHHLTKPAQPTGGLDSAVRSDR